MPTLPFLLSLTIAVAAGQDPATDKKPKDKDSVQVVATGCLKGRAFAAMETREGDVVSGPNVSGRTFRLAGKGDVMDEVKRLNGKLVEVTGLVKTSALQQPGIEVGGGRTRVVFGAPPMGSDPTRIDPRRDTASGVPVLDVTAVRLVDESCAAAQP